MTREEKSLLIDELENKFRSTPNFYLANANGMTVADINRFRRICFEKGIVYKVYKNTLIEKALERLDADYSPLNGTGLKGTTGIMFSEDPKLPAKVLKDFSKGLKEQRPAFKAASIDASFFIGADQLDALVQLKTKAELIGEIVGLLQSPMKNVVSALQGGGHKLSGILKTLSEKEG
jgi:large subunit ribosomal protein L10